MPTTFTPADAEVFIKTQLPILKDFIEKNEGHVNSGLIYTLTKELQDLMQLAVDMFAASKFEDISMSSESEIYEYLSDIKKLIKTDESLFLSITLLLAYAGTKNIAASDQNNKFIAKLASALYKHQNTWAEKNNGWLEAWINGYHMQNIEDSGKKLGESANYYVEKAKIVLPILAVGAGLYVGYRYGLFRLPPMPKDLHEFQSFLLRRPHDHCCRH